MVQPVSTARNVERADESLRELATHHAAWKRVLPSVPPGAQSLIAYIRRADGSPLHGMLEGLATSEQLIVAPTRIFSGQMTITVDGHSGTVTIPPVATPKAVPPATPQAKAAPQPLDGIVREKHLSGIYSKRMFIDRT